jgi:hypothetical protein
MYEAMISRRNRDDSQARLLFGHRISFLEIPRKCHHPARRWRLMAADNDVMIGGQPELAGHDLGFHAARFVDEPEFLRHLVVEGTMNPTDEIDRGRDWQLPAQPEAVNHPLNFDMGLGL